MIAYTRPANWLLFTATILLGHGSAHAQEGADPGQSSEYSPYVGQDFPRQVFFGDTHHHSSYSFDSGMFGNTLGPQESFRFAQGQEVTASNGMKAKLIRPLDFLVIADHSDNMGFFPDMIAGAPHILSVPKGRDWYNRVMAGEGVGVAIELIGLFSQGEFPKDLVYYPDSKPYKLKIQMKTGADPVDREVQP